MAAVESLSYNFPPPSQHVGSVMKGLVSHLETDCFWLQMEPGKFIRLLIEEGMREKVGPVLCVGECVLGWWEGEWYRGVVTELLQEGEVNIRFVDWGNSATLARDSVRRATKKDAEIASGAVKCKLLGRDLVGWDEKLVQSEYMVELMCLAMYEDTYLVTETMSTSTTLPIQKDINGTVSHVCLDRTTLWFLPTTSQSALDTLMDKLDQFSTKLTSLPVSHVFPGQLCAAKFTGDGGMYRARVTMIMEKMVSVFYIDYGDREDKDMSDLFMLPDELLITPPAVVEVETDNIVNSEQEDKLMAEEVVLRLEGGNGMRLAKFFIFNEEIIFLSEKVTEETFPVGVKIEVSLGHVETVRVVWVTPVNKIEGLVACEEMVDEITKVLASQKELIPLGTTQPGLMAATRFSEDGLLYRCRVEEEGGIVRFIDFGNGEEKEDKLLFKMPKDVEKFPCGAFRINLDIEDSWQNTEDNMIMVEEKLGGTNVFLVLDKGAVGTFYRGEEVIKFCQQGGEGAEKESMVPKGCIIEISMSDEEEIEVSDGEETQTESIPASQVPVPVTVNRVESVFTVWVTRATSYPALDRLRDQLADLDGLLTTKTMVDVGDLVVARFTEDGELYRGKLVSIANQFASVLFIDYGDSEHQSVNSFMVLPEHFRDIEPLAERVKLEGGEMLKDCVETRDMVDKELNKEGISMIINDHGEASFWEDGEKIEFDIAASNDESSIGGWKVGDMVAYRTSDTLWRRGVIQGAEQGQVRVKGEKDTEMMVDIRHIKSAEMPLEALNKMEEDLIKSVQHYHGEQGDHPDHLHNHGLDIDTEVQKVNPVKPIKHLPTAKILQTVQMSLKSDQDLTASDSKIFKCEVSQPDQETELSDSLVTKLCVSEQTDAFSNKQERIISPKSDMPSTQSSSTAVTNVVFRPTASLPQQVVTDWIAGCVEMMDRRKGSKAVKDKENYGDMLVTDDATAKTENIRKHKFISPNFSSTSPLSPLDPHLSQPHTLPTSSSPSATPDPTILSPNQFLCYSQTLSGSEMLKHLLSTGDQKTKASILQSVVSSDLMEMVTTPLSCQVVQKLCSCLDPDKMDQLVIPISKQFFNLSLHPFGHQAVLAVLAVASQGQRNMITSQLENENILLELLKDKQGSFVVQRCLPYILPGTVSCIVSSLEDKVVEVGCHPLSSFFLQEFFRLFNGKDRVDILQEKVMDSLECMVYNQVGHWVVQTIIKLGHPSHITRVASWLESNMQKVILDCRAVFVARTLIQQLLARSRKGVENSWSLAMDKLMWKMTDTMVMFNGTSLPLIIVAAMHSAGHIVIQEVARQKEWLGQSRMKVMNIFEQNRLRLRVDTFGCLVVKGLEGWM